MAFQRKYLSKTEKLQQQKDDLDFLIQKGKKDLERWKNMSQTMAVTQNVARVTQEVASLERERLALK